MTGSTAARTPSTLPEDCLEIFHAPARVFERRRGKGFLLPLLILVVLMGVLYVATKDLIRPALDAQMATAMAQARRENPGMTEEQLAAMRGMGGTMALVGMIVSSAVAPLVVGLMLWLAGKGVGARQTLGDAMTVGVFAWYPRLLGVVAGGVIALLLPESALTSLWAVTLSAARFADPATTPPAALAMLGRLEVFTLWSTVLLAVGLRVTGRASTAQAAVAAAVVWLVASLATVLPALAQG